jgi:hypothetical protein
LNRWTAVIVAPAVSGLVARIAGADTTTTVAAMFGVTVLAYVFAKVGSDD